MPKKRPEDVIRVGDRVEITNPRIVKRVGYKIIWTDLMEEMEKSEKVAKAYEALTGFKRIPDLDGFFGRTSKKDRDIPYYFLQACAKIEVENQQWGGDERVIIYDPEFKDPYFTIGGSSKVYGKMIRKTGTRFPSNSWYDSYTGEYDEEPGGLLDEKTHILINTNFGWMHSEDVKKIHDTKHSDNSGSTIIRTLNKR